MRRFLLVAALVAGLLLPGCGDDDDERITASAPDFAVELPAGWEEQDAETREEAGEAGIGAVGDELGISEDAQFEVDIQAIWSVTDPSPEFATNINVFSESLDGASHADYMRFSRDQLEGTQFATEVGELKAGPAIGGEPSQGFEYGATQQGVKLRFRLVSTPHGGDAYNITLSAPADEFEAASADLDDILASWTWNE